LRLCGPHNCQLSVAYQPLSSSEKPTIDERLSIVISRILHTVRHPASIKRSRRKRMPKTPVCSTFEPSQAVINPTHASVELELLHVSERHQYLCAVTMPTSERRKLPLPPRCHVVATIATNMRQLTLAIIPVRPTPGSATSMKLSCAQVWSVNFRDRRFIAVDVLT